MCDVALMDRCMKEVKVLVGNVDAGLKINRTGWGVDGMPVCR